MKKLLIPASIALFCSGFALAAEHINDDIVIYEGDISNELIISASPQENATLYFGESLSHYLRWDADRNLFVFSDDVDFGGHQLLNMRIENLPTAPQCDVNSSGRLYYNTGSNQSFVCNGTLWKQVDEEVVGATSPYVSSISPVSLNASETTTLTIAGGGFTPNATVVIPGIQGTVGTVTVISPTELQLDITPSSEDSGTFDIIINSNGITNSTWNGNGVDILEIINSTTLVPGVDTTIWEKETQVVTSQGKLLPADDTQAWTKGASFGTVAANTDFTLSLTPVYMDGMSADGYAMFGVDNSDPDINYETIDYAFYIAGDQLSIYENGNSRGSFGSFAIGDTLSIMREGTIIKYIVNNSIVYTSSIASSSQIVFDSSIYRWLGAENISLEY